MLWSIVGLGSSGRSTFFRLMTHRGLSGRTGKGLSIAVAEVPDPRIERLVEIFEPRKVVPAEIEFADSIAAVGSGGAAFSELQHAGALIFCVRAFDGGFGSPDPMGDLDKLTSELALFDLSVLERKAENIEKSFRGARSDVKQRLEREKRIVDELRERIESGGSIRDMELDAAHSEIVSNFAMLTAKPVVIVLNCDDDRYAERERLLAEVAEKYPRIPALAIMAKTELELGEFDEEEANAFREEFGLSEPVIDRFILKAYDAAGIMTFFTCGEKEVHAWSIAKGATALEAAGRIHSDLARGFIRAEVVSYEHILEDGGWAEARAAGHLRLEGKEHIIEDGDTIVIKFAI